MRCGELVDAHQLLRPADEEVMNFTSLNQMLAIDRGLS